MKLKPIKKQDYFQALERLKLIFDAMHRTNEDDELEISGILLDNYKNEHFPFKFPDSIVAIKFKMEPLNCSQNDLAKIIGLKRRASIQFTIKNIVNNNLFYSSGWKC